MKNAKYSAILPAPICKNSIYQFRSLTDMPAACTFLSELCSKYPRCAGAGSTQFWLNQLQISDDLHILQDNTGKLLAPQP